VLALAVLASEPGTETLAAGPAATSAVGAVAGLAAEATTVAPPGSDTCAGAAGSATGAEGCAAEWMVSRGLSSLLGRSSGVDATGAGAGVMAPALLPGGCRQRLDGMCDLEACGCFAMVVVVDVIVELVVVVTIAADS